MQRARVQARQLLWHSRMPLPLPPHRCTCHGQLDALGDHRAACATSGVLSTPALPLEHAVARVCREAGTRVARNVRLARQLRTWSSSAPRLAAGSAPRRCIFCAFLHGTEPCPGPCDLQRSASVLELPLAADLGDGPGPELHELLAEAC